MGFCRINLFKRLESAGPAFLLSIERHILRNFIVLHAIENNLDIPLGTQSADLLDSRYHDGGSGRHYGVRRNDNGDVDEEIIDLKITNKTTNNLHTEEDFRDRAAKAYTAYNGPFKNRFKWLPSTLFTKDLAKHLLRDAKALIDILEHCGKWNAEKDTKLAELVKLIKEQHGKDKLLVFTQFADTARYLKDQLEGRGIKQVEEATGESADPTTLAWRFSPESNSKRD